MGICRQGDVPGSRSSFREGVCGSGAGRERVGGPRLYACVRGQACLRVAAAPELNEKFKTTPTQPWLLAIVYCALATREERYRDDMFRWLNKVYEERSSAGVHGQLVLASLPCGSPLDCVPQEAGVGAVGQMRSISLSLRRSCCVRMNPNSSRCFRGTQRSTMRSGLLGGSPRSLFVGLASNRSLQISSWKPSTTENLA